MRDRPRTVMIFAHECAPHHRPESTIGAQRPAQFAKYLPEFGWRAIVVCCDARRRHVPGPHRVAEEALAAVAEAEPDESVIVPVPSLPYDGTLDQLWRASAERAGRGSRAWAAVRKALTVAKLPLGDWSQAWQPCAREAAEAIADAVPVDAALGEHSPDAGIFLARWFHERRGVPWVADFRDPVLQPLKPALRVVNRPIVRRMLRSASATINVTPYWTQLDREMFGLPAHTIPNGFDPDEFPARPGVARSPRFTIAYTGRMWPEMRIRTFLDGLARLRDLVGAAAFRDVRFVYRGADHDAVRARAADAGVGDALDCDAHIDRRASLELLQRADLLLLLAIPDGGTRDVYLRRGVYPGKAFEYFGARRPILCVPGDGGQLDELVLRTGTGAIVRTPDEIAAHLRGLLERWRADGRLPYEPNESEVARYSRRVQAGELASVLDAAVAGASSSPGADGAGARMTAPAAAAGSGRA